jgi:formamidopyrimidine-DNA glycosylase
MMRLVHGGTLLKDLMLRQALPEAAAVYIPPPELVEEEATEDTMPELPEVETVMRGLAPALAGRRIAHCEVRRAGLRVPFPKNFAIRLTGKRVTALRRRAKYILADLDSCETLVIHLGMSGRMTVSETRPPLAKHDHVVLTTNVATIIFNDPRRFGLMTLVDTATLEQDALFAGLGPEPLADDFNAKVLAASLAGKKTPMKAALLNQRVVAGLGNIYVSEALFRAGISPRRHAGTVKDMTRLVRAIKDVLNAAIRSGGSTLRDYRHADGSLGRFQHAFKVYDRAGAPCPRPNCGGTLKRIVQSGRSTYYCPKCQK